MEMVQTTSKDFDENNWDKMPYIVQSTIDSTAKNNNETSWLTVAPNIQ